MKSIITLLLAACSAGICAAADDDLAQRLAEHGEFIVGTEGTYPPFTYHDESGKLTGYDVEVTRAIADQLGVKLSFRETPWNALLAGLNNGRFDAVANQVSMSSPERRAKYVSSTPYSYSGIAIAVNPAQAEVKNLDDLKGLTGGLAFTSNFADLVRKHGATVEPVEGGLAQEMALVAQGRMDFTLNDRLAVLYYRKSIPNDQVKVIDLPEEGTFSAGLILLKDQQDAARLIDGAIAELKANGTLSRLSEQFFGEDVSVE